MNLKKKGGKSAFILLFSSRHFCHISKNKTPQREATKERAELLSN